MPKYDIHPECKKAVDSEYSRLHLKNPLVPNHIKVDIAKRFVRAIAIADSIAFMKSMEVDQSGAY